MNVTELVYLGVELIKHRLVNDFHCLRSLTWLAFRLLKVGLQSIVVIPFGLLLDVCDDLWRVCSTLACIWILILSIGFIKSLKPRYDFSPKQSKPAAAVVAAAAAAAASKQADPNRELREGTRSAKLASNRQALLDDWANSGWPIKRFIGVKFAYLLELLWLLANAANSAERVCSASLSVPDIETVHGRLSWSHTQVDVESANWLNQSLRTFWPSVKTLLNKFLINDLLKPRPKGSAKNEHLANESRKLSKQQPKLSVYISCRRKLDLIRQIEFNARHRCGRQGSFAARGAIWTVFSLIKLAIVYLKQLIIDYMLYLFKKKKEREQKTAELNLVVRKLLEAGRRATKDDGTTKSWAGFDLSARRNAAKLAQPVATGKRARKFKSAPLPRRERPKRPRRHRLPHHGLLLGPRGMSKLRDKRLKLANRFRRAYDNSSDDQNGRQQQLTIERIRLGDSIPILSGVRYVANRANSASIGPVGVAGRRHLVASDERNMRFVAEISYASDSKFSIQLSAGEWPGRIRLVGFQMQLRCYITLNHTISELNRDLEIFDTPGDVLFPAINYVQLSLVDAPTFDWTLERPSRKLTPRGELELARPKLVRPPLGLARRLTDFVHRRMLLDPVDIINHSYFKFIVHSIIRLSLRWFQPFDIQIGPHLYLKTIC